jgi:RNA-directed DNA polymerase
MLSRMAALSADSEWKTRLRRRPRIQRCAIFTAPSTLALSRGLYGRAGMIAVHIRGFFDAIDHGWMLKFLEHRIGDKTVLRLIQKWLKAGVLESGKKTVGIEGTPQGATISPLLANIYLHFVFDLWARQWRKRHARHEIIIVR